MRIVLSIIAIAVGVIITLKANWIVQNFGTVQFGERYLGSSVLFWKFFGILVIAVSALTMVGVTQFLLGSFFGILIHR